MYYRNKKNIIINYIIVLLILYRFFIDLYEKENTQ